MKTPITSSEKEMQQLALCQRLIINHSYGCQDALRRDMQRHGFQAISQSTISRLLRILGVIKIRNARGEKIYSLSPQEQPEPSAGRAIGEMVISVEHNAEFVILHTVAGYGRAVGKILDYRALPDVLGVVAGSSVVWVAPRDVTKTPHLHHKIVQTFGLTAVLPQPVAVR